MSTDDCKKFIESVAKENGLTTKDKWKRLRKYKQDNLVLRDFENPNGDVLVISESKDGAFLLHEFKINIILPDAVKSTLNKENLLVELFKMYVDIGRSDTCFKSENESYKKDGVSFKALMEYYDNGNDSLLKEEIKNYNMRSGEELDVGHYVAYELEYKELGYNNDENFISETSPDKIGVVYDKENIIFTYKEKEGISYFLMKCGGDWENPVMMFVYWSEKDQRLKGFFPKGEGNVYNIETNTAYGSEMEQSNLSWSDHEYEKLEIKYEKMREKIDDDFRKHYDKAESNGFKQLKKFILKDNSPSLKM